MPVSPPFEILPLLDRPDDLDIPSPVTLSLARRIRAAPCGRTSFSFSTRRVRQILGYQKTKERPTTEERDRANAEVPTGEKES